MPGNRLQQRARLRRARPARAPDGRRRGRRRGRESDAGPRAARRARSAAPTRRAPCALIACARAAHCGIVGEQLAVLLHRRPAAGGVDDDPVDAGRLEHLDVVTRERARLVDAGRRGAAARRSTPARAGASTRQPFGGQHANGGLVDVAQTRSAARSRSSSADLQPLRLRRPACARARGRAATPRHPRRERQQRVADAPEGARQTAGRARRLRPPSNQRSDDAAAAPSAGAAARDTG